MSLSAQPVKSAAITCLVAARLGSNSPNCSPLTEAYPVRGGLADASSVWSDPVAVARHSGLTVAAKKRSFWVAVVDQSVGTRPRAGPGLDHRTHETLSRVPGLPAGPVSERFAPFAVPVPRIRTA